VGVAVVLNNLAAAFHSQGNVRFKKKLCGLLQSRRARLTWQRLSQERKTKRSSCTSDLSVFAKRRTARSTRYSVADSLLHWIFDDLIS